MNCKKNYSENVCLLKFKFKLLNFLHYMDIFKFKYNLKLK